LAADWSLVHFYLCLPWPFYSYSKGAMTLSITTFSMMIFSIGGLFATFSINDIQHNNIQHDDIHDIQHKVIILDIQHESITCNIQHK